MPYSQGLTQAYQLRNLSSAQALDLGQAPATKLRDKLAKAQGFAALVKSWEITSDRIRIMRGHPLPGSRKPEPRKPKNSAKWSDVPPGAA